MRRFSPALRSLALAIAGSAVLTASALAQSLAVPIDQTALVSLPAAARDVIIGNPLIIDVNLLNARNAVVMGKAYGVTSLQVFDEHGRSIYARQIVVSASDDNRVTFYRGPNVTNYACGPRCERTPMPGEVEGELDPFVTGYTSYSDRQQAANAAAAPAPAVP